MQTTGCNLQDLVLATIASGMASFVNAFRQFSRWFVALEAFDLPDLLISVSFIGKLHRLGSVLFDTDGWPLDFP